MLNAIIWCTRPFLKVLAALRAEYNLQLTERPFGDGPQKYIDWGPRPRRIRRRYLSPPPPPQS